MSMKNGKGRKIALAVLSLLAFGYVQAQEAKDTLKLTLDKALEIALSENPTVKVAGQEIVKKQYAKKGVVAQLFPQIAASAGYTRTLKKQVMYMGGGSEGGGFTDMFKVPLEGVADLYQKSGYDVPLGIQATLDGLKSSDSSSGMEVGLDNNWNGGFSLSLPIYAPTLYKSIQLTAIDIELAAEQSRASKQDLVNQVSKAYYQLLLAQDSYKVLQQSYKQAEDNFRIVSSKFEQGLVSEYDKIRSEVQMRNINPALIQAKNAVAITKLQLQVLIGMEEGKKISVVGQLADYEGGLYGDYLKVDTTMLGNNTNLRQLELQSKMLKKNYEMDKAAFLPNISLSGLYQWAAMNDDFKFKDYKWNPYSTIGVTISLPIYTGGSRMYKIKQSKIQMSQIDLNALNTRRNLSMQAQSCVNNMQQSVEQLASNIENVKQAMKGYNIAQKRYEVGKGTIIELTDAELMVTQSKLTYHQSIYDYLVAKADLNKVLGNDNLIEK